MPCVKWFFLGHFLRTSKEKRATKRSDGVSYLYLDHDRKKERLIMLHPWVSVKPEQKANVIKKQLTPELNGRSEDAASPPSEEGGSLMKAEGHWQTLHASSSKGLKFRDRPTWKLTGDSAGRHNQILISFGLRECGSRRVKGKASNRFLHLKKKYGNFSMHVTVQVSVVSRNIKG